MVGVLGKEGKEEVGREKCVWEGEGKGREEMGRAKGGRERKVCVWEGEGGEGGGVHVVSEPDPRKIGKEGLVNGVG